MHTRLLDVLHHATDEHLPGRVADRVDVDLHRVLEEAIDEHRALSRQTPLAAEAAGIRELGHRTVQLLIVVDDLHRPPAEHIGGTNQRRIADARRDRTSGLGRRRGAPGGLRDLEARTQCAPLLAVLGEVDRLGARPHHEPGRQRSRELERGLAAQRHDDADGLLGLDDVEHVLRREGLEVEAVARVVVGRDGLGVAVDHHGLVARIAQRERGVHAAVVELDPLTDAVRPRPEDDDPRLRRRSHLVLVLVGAVVVRRVRGELGAAGVDGLEGDLDPGLEPSAADSASSVPKR